MKNKEAEISLINCNEELEAISAIRKIVGLDSPIMLYLTRYAIIKSCGTVEFSYKNLIADFCEDSQSQQTKNFITNKVRNSSNNPSIENIYRLLADFDSTWLAKFKSEINSLSEKDKILTSLKSLNDARNDFAHGGNPSASFEDIRKYFEDARQLIILLDEIIN